MGNLKGRARRNNKPNNWKSMRSKKKAIQPDILEQDTEANMFENQTINSEDNEMIEERSIKRQRMSDDENQEIASLSATGTEQEESHYTEKENLCDVDEVDEDEVDDDEVDDDEVDDDEVDDDEVDNDEVDNDEVDNDEVDNDEVDDDGVDDDQERKSDSSSSSDDDDINEVKLTGRRMFEVSDLFHKIKRICMHSKKCNDIADMQLLGETKKGLNSVFKFQCKKCGMLRKLESNPKKPDALTINEEAVLGINLIGSGYYHLQEFLTNLGVYCMSSSNYEKISNKQQPDWYNAAKKCAMEALQEEINMAIAAGDVDSNGNALIAVICDGGWGKRSYGKKFNSKSGCAVLVGVRTKQVIFFGVRNKYCHICKIAEAHQVEVRDHACNINYRGPSSGMEADIILEGFQECEKLGARFHKLIADGDSSTYKILRDFRVYKYPDLVIEKLECVNHLCRNFRSKFGFLENVTKFDVKLRKHVKPSKGNDICKGVKTAAKHWRESGSSLSEKIRYLEDDIMNAPAHYFGVHTDCRSYFCKKHTSEAANKNLALLKKDGLYYEVLNLCQVYFAANVKSLLENQTNNAAEEFNNVVAKYLGGKRINYALGRSYSARVASAVVQYNTGGHAGSAFRKFKLGNHVQSSTLPLENSRKRKLIYNAAALQTKPRDRHPKESTSAAGYHHGDGSENVDMEPDQLEKCKKIFLDKLKKRQNNRKRIERDTIDKNYSPLWHEIRQDIFPAEHFYRVINAMRRDSYTNILKEIMYNRSEFGNNAQIKHQRLVERDALAVCRDLFPYDFKECGLFVDKKFPFLCASPFRLYGKHGILNIKCPIKEYDRPFDEVISKIKFFKIKDNDVTINEKSEWFIELQGQLYVTDRKFAHLMIWLGESNYRVIEVARNDKFFEENMKEKLVFFYNECMLKELVDSRVRRNMKLRTYDASTLSFE